MFNGNETEINSNLSSSLNLVKVTHTHLIRELLGVVVVVEVRGKWASE